MFFHEVVALARANHWVSDEHFSVDGTLIEAWASMKSFRPKTVTQGLFTHKTSELSFTFEAVSQSKEPNQAPLPMPVTVTRMALR